MAGELIPIERKPGRDPAAPEPVRQSKGTAKGRSGSPSAKKPAADRGTTAPAGGRSRTARPAAAAPLVQPVGEGQRGAFILDDRDLAALAPQEPAAAFVFDLPPAEGSGGRSPAAGAEVRSQPDPISPAGGAAPVDRRAAVCWRRRGWALGLPILGVVAAILWMVMGARVPLVPKDLGGGGSPQGGQIPVVQSPVTPAVQKAPPRAPARVVKKIAIPSLAGMKITAPTRPAPATRKTRRFTPGASSPDAPEALPTAIPPTFPAGEDVLPDVDALLQLAEEYRQAGDRPRAEALYRRLMQEGPQRGRAAQALGDLYFQAGDYRRAGELYQEAAGLFRDEAR